MSKAVAGIVNSDEWTFKPLTEYFLDPLEITAIGLYKGETWMRDRIAEAKKRGVREFAIIGDCSIRVSLRPPEDMRPPEGWLREWVKPRYLAQAKQYCTQ